MLTGTSIDSYLMFYIFISHVIIPASNNETTPTYDEATPINNETVPTNNETKPTDDEATPINNETKPTDDEAAPTNNEVVPTDDETTPIASDGGVVKKTTWDSLETQRRRFNFDLLPKVGVVFVLISIGCYSYCTVVVKW